MAAILRATMPESEWTVFGGCTHLIFDAGSFDQSRRSLRAYFGGNIKIPPNNCPQTPFSSVYITSPTMLGDQGGVAMNDMWELDAPSEAKKLEELYHLYRDTMLYVAVGILRNGYLAEDAVQEAFVRIAANLSKISKVDSKQTKVYVAVIVRNVALTILNDMNRQVFIDNIDSLAYVESGTKDSILNRMEYEEVVAAIRKLPDTFREILDLYYIQGFKVTEISERLGLNREVVKKRIQRGKKKLLEMLAWDENIP